MCSSLVKMVAPADESVTSFPKNTLTYQAVKLIMAVCDGLHSLGGFLLDVSCHKDDLEWGVIEQMT